jgi:hypothetical protein
MKQQGSAASVLDREFLGVRCRLIDLAAALDRIERGGGAAAGDPRCQQIRRALEILASGGAARAEGIELAFSLPVDGSQP